MKLNSILQDVFSIEDCMNHPNQIYVFGDNLLHVGKSGQAIIRDCPNAYGIPTKRKPNMNSDSFFSDEFYEYEIVKSSIEKLVVKAFYNDIIVVFPTNGLGTGLAQMNIHSPKLFKYMNQQLSKLFGVYNE